MTSDTRADLHPTFVDALTRLARVFAHPLTDEQLLLYADALDDIPPEDVSRAVDVYVKFERFWPRPVAIRSYVQKQQRQRSLPARPLPLIEWDATLGQNVQIASCSVCQDKGVVPLRQDKSRISWDESRGVGDFVGRGTGHYNVERCDVCNKLAPERPAVMRASFDEEQDGRRGRAGGRSWT
jgi:hypothetical protein